MELDRVFQSLDNTSIRVSVGKTNLARDSILLLGHCVSGEGIEPNTNKVMANQKLSEP